MGSRRPAHISIKHGAYSIKYTFAQASHISIEHEAYSLKYTFAQASHISGTTVHSAFGVGVPEHYEDFKRVWGKRDWAREKLRVLVLDEVSMAAGGVTHTPRPA